MSRVAESRECPECQEPNYAGSCMNCGFAEVGEEGEAPEPHPLTDGGTLLMRQRELARQFARDRAEYQADHTEDER